MNSWKLSPSGAKTPPPSSRQHQNERKSIPQSPSVGLDSRIEPRHAFLPTSSFRSEHGVCSNTVLRMAARPFNKMCTGVQDYFLRHEMGQNADPERRQVAEQDQLHGVDLLVNAVPSPHGLLKIPSLVRPIGPQFRRRPVLLAHSKVLLSLHVLWKCIACPLPWDFDGRLKGGKTSVPSHVRDHTRGFVPFCVYAHIHLCLQIALHGYARFPRLDRALQLAMDEFTRDLSVYGEGARASFESRLYEPRAEELQRNTSARRQGSVTALRDFHRRQASMLASQLRTSCADTALAELGQQLCSMKTIRSLWHVWQCSGQVPFQEPSCAAGENPGMTRNASDNQAERPDQAPANSNSHDSTGSSDLVVSSNTEPAQASTSQEPATISVVVRPRDRVNTPALVHQRCLWMLSRFPHRFALMSRQAFYASYFDLCASWCSGWSLAEHLLFMRKIVFRITTGDFPVVENRYEQYRRSKQPRKTSRRKKKKSSCKKTGSSSGRGVSTQSTTTKTKKCKLRRKRKAKERASRATTEMRQPKPIPPAAAMLPPPRASRSRQVFARRLVDLEDVICADRDVFLGENAVLPRRICDRCDGFVVPAQLDRPVSSSNGSHTRGKKRQPLGRIDAVEVRAALKGILEPGQALCSCRKLLDSAQNGMQEDTSKSMLFLSNASRESFVSIENPMTIVKAARLRGSLSPSENEDQRRLELKARIATLSRRLRKEEQLKEILRRDIPPLGQLVPSRCLDMHHQKWTAFQAAYASCEASSSVIRSVLRRQPVCFLDFAKELQLLPRASDTRRLFDLMAGCTPLRKRAAEPAATLPVSRQAKYPKASRARRSRKRDTTPGQYPRSAKASKQPPPRSDSGGATPSEQGRMNEACNPRIEVTIQQRETLVTSSKDSVTAERAEEDLVLNVDKAQQLLDEPDDSTADTTEPAGTASENKAVEILGESNVPEANNIPNAPFRENGTGGPLTSRPMHNQSNELPSKLSVLNLMTPETSTGTSNVGMRGTRTRWKLQNPAVGEQTLSFAVIGHRDQGADVIGPASQKTQTPSPNANTPSEAYDADAASEATHTATQHPDPSSQTTSTESEDKHPASHGTNKGSQKDKNPASRDTETTLQGTRSASRDTNIASEDARTAAQGTITASQDTKRSTQDSDTALGSTDTQLHGLEQPCADAEVPRQKVATTGVSSTRVGAPQEHGGLEEDLILSSCAVTVDLHSNENDCSAWADGDTESSLPALPVSMRTESPHAQQLLESHRAGVFASLAGDVAALLHSMSNPDVHETESVKPVSRTAKLWNAVFSPKGSRNEQHLDRDDSVIAQESGDGAASLDTGLRTDGMSVQESGNDGNLASRDARDISPLHIRKSRRQKASRRKPRQKRKAKTLVECVGRKELRSKKRSSTPKQDKLEPVNPSWKPVDASGRLLKHLALLMHQDLQRNDRSTFKLSEDLVDEEIEIVLRNTERKVARLKNRASLSEEMSRERPQSPGHTTPRKLHADDTQPMDPKSSALCVGGKVPSTSKDGASSMIETHQQRKVHIEHLLHEANMQIISEKAMELQLLNNGSARQLLARKLASYKCSSEFSEMVAARFLDLMHMDVEVSSMQARHENLSIDKGNKLGSAESAEDLRKVFKREAFVECHGKDNNSAVVVIGVQNCALAENAGDTSRDPMRDANDIAEDPPSTVCDGTLLPTGVTNPADPSDCGDPGVSEGELASSGKISHGARDVIGDPRGLQLVYEGHGSPPTAANWLSSQAAQRPANYFQDVRSAELRDNWRVLEGGLHGSGLGHVSMHGARGKSVDSVRVLRGRAGRAQFSQPRSRPSSDHEGIHHVQFPGTDRNARIHEHDEHRPARSDVSGERDRFFNYGAPQKLLSFPQRSFSQVSERAVEYEQHHTEQSDKPNLLNSFAGGVGMKSPRSIVRISSTDTQKRAGMPYAIRVPRTPIMRQKGVHVRGASMKLSPAVPKLLRYPRDGRARSMGQRSLTAATSNILAERTRQPRPRSSRSLCLGQNFTDRQWQIIQRGSSFPLWAIRHANRVRHNSRSLESKASFNHRYEDKSSLLELTTETDGMSGSTSFRSLQRQSKGPEIHLQGWEGDESPLDYTLPKLYYVPRQVRSRLAEASRTVDFLLNGGQGN